MCGRRHDDAFRAEPQSVLVRSEIQGAPNIVVQAPQVQFGANFVSVMSLCRSGSALRAQPGVGVPGEVPVESTPQRYDVVVA